MEPRVIATGLQFPEGPIALDDGSVLLVEIKRGTLSRVQPDGRVEVVAEPGGGPNGAAFGPDGSVYLCNNGGCFEFEEMMGFTLPGPVPPTWTGGSIQKVDLATGSVTTVYTESSTGPLARAQRPRLRRARRVLVHRPRRAPRSHERPHRAALRVGRRVVMSRGRVPVGRSERDRAVTGRLRALRGRDPHRAGVLVAGHRSRRGGRHHARGPRRSPRWPAFPGCSCSTSSRWTAKDGCASARS